MEYTQEAEGLKSTQKNAEPSIAKHCPVLFGTIVDLFVKQGLGVVSHKHESPDGNSIGFHSRVADILLIFKVANLQKSTRGGATTMRKPKILNVELFHVSVVQLQPV